MNILARIYRIVRWGISFDRWYRELQSEALRVAGADYVRQMRVADWVRQYPEPYKYWMKPQDRLKRGPKGHGPFVSGCEAFYPDFTW